MGAFRKTIAVDFDKVCHTYDRGWLDGSIYGDLMPGTAEGLRALMVDFGVYILTARTRVLEVAEWLEARTGIPTVPELDVSARTFWDVPGVLLVTCRKLPAEVYLDDRAVRFTTWERAIADIRSITGQHPRGNTMHESTEQRAVLDDITAIATDETAEPAQALAAIRERLAAATKDTCHDGAPRSADDLETK